MRLRGILFGLALATSLCVMGSPVFAQAGGNPTISVDEHGHGMLLFPGGVPIVTQGILAPDPGPGGLAAALTYNLLGPPGLVAGDLILLEGGVISDIVRFNPAGTGGNPAYPASLVFYSDNADGVDALADRGFPTALYPNTVTVFEVGPEGANGFTYTPTQADPGFVPGFNVTYRIVSDGTLAVPEPSSLALGGLMVTLGGACTVWKKARRKQTA